MKKLDEKINRPDRAMLDIWIGSYCSNDCIFCAEGGRGPGRTLPLEKMKELLRGNPDVKQVVFSGGEPTLNKNILSYIKLAKKYNFPQRVLVTNGRRLFSEGFCKDILVSGINEIRISMHGHTAEIHDCQTRSKGSFNELVKGVVNLARLKNSYKFSLVAVVVMNKLNYKFLTDILRFAEKVDFDRINFHVVEPVDDGLNNAFKNFDKVVADYEKLAVEVRKMLDYREKSSSYIAVAVDSLPYCLMRGYEDFVGQRDITIGFDPASADYDLVTLGDSYGKEKVKSCEKCVYWKVCEGAWSEYVKRKGGGEFKPILVA